MNNESAARLVEVQAAIMRDARRAQPLEILQRLFDRVMLACADNRNRTEKAIDAISHRRHALIAAVAAGDSAEAGFLCDEIRERCGLPRPIRNQVDDAD